MKKKRRNAPLAPIDSYLISGLVTNYNSIIPVGSFADDYSPFGEMFNCGQEDVTDHLVRNPVELDADLVGSGRESVAESNQCVDREWPTFPTNSLGSVGPNGTVVRCLEVYRSPFSLAAVLNAADLGGELISEYGKYHLADRPL